MFKLLLIILSSVSVYSLKFTEYINKYNKQYSDDELPTRLSIYKDNLRKIQEHNSQGHSWKMDVNQFTDLTQEEFKAKSGSICFNKRNNRDLSGFNLRTTYKELPESFDWVEKGAVTDVKDQQSCGSCYAFSTTGAVEGAYFVATGKLVSLSEQEIVDCSGSFGNQGCNGGLMNYGFEFIKNKGICLEKDYSYKAVTGLCKKCKSVTKVSSYVNVPEFDEDALQQAVYTSPVSIAIEADTSIFQSYSSGVMDSVSCGTSLDHGVLVVGWGTLNGKKYWKVKNSWGSSWGDRGYILLGRGNNICGLATEPSYPVITKS